MNKIKLDSLNELKLSSEKLGSLILHYDDFNSFEFIIKSLIDICGHNAEQAEQCALIAHYKGKCQILTDTIENLVQIRGEFTIKNITVTIE